MPHHDRNVMALCSEWLKKEDEDYGVARHLIDENSIYLHAIAFHSRQAAEKYLKALLVYY
jgi:HEPN domain-containing protein